MLYWHSLKSAQSVNLENACNLFYGHDLTNNGPTIGGAKCTMARALTNFGNHDRRPHGSNTTQCLAKDAYEL